MKNANMEPAYTLERAVELVREIEPKLSKLGIHSALTGSILYKGVSIKDFDIMLYPHNPSKSHTLEYVRQSLLDIGFECVQKFGGKLFNSLGSGAHNGRVVDIMSYKGYRVDVFLDVFPISINTEKVSENDEDVPF